MTLWTSSCDPSATSSAVLVRSSVVVPLLQFIVRVDSVRDGVFVVLSSVVNRDRCPEFLAFWHGFGVLQYIDKVVNVPGDAAWLLYGGLWKNFTYVLRVARAVCLESSRYFQSSLYLAATCPCVCDSPRRLLDEFHLLST